MKSVTQDLAVEMIDLLRSNFTTQINYSTCVLGADRVKSWNVGNEVKRDVSSIG